MGGLTRLKLQAVLATLHTPPSLGRCGGEVFFGANQQVNTWPTVTLTSDLSVSSITFCSWPQPPCACVPRHRTTPLALALAVVRRGLAYGVKGFHPLNSVACFARTHISRQPQQSLVGRWRQLRSFCRGLGQTQGGRVDERVVSSTAGVCLFDRPRSPW